MNTNKILKAITYKIYNDISDFTRDKIEKISLKKFSQEGRVPWSNGYHIYRKRYISEVLSNDMLLKRFLLKEKLPLGYGIGIDERCVEIPWLISRLSNESELILDAGSALNHSFILDHSSFQKKTVHLMTLAPEKNCFWQRGFSYLFDDLRSIPIRESFYDMIICLSTLEHVGCDNESFTNDNLYKENNPNDFVLVMQEFRRVLKPGGILLLTVPYGTNKHFLTFQQFDMKMLQRAIDAFGKTKRVTGNFYKYSDKGWNISDEENCSECEFVEWVALPKHKRPNPLPVEPDLAAAARAVACVQIVKA